MCDLWSLLVCNCWNVWNHHPITSRVSGSGYQRGRWLHSYTWLNRSHALVVVQEVGIAMCILLCHGSAYFKITSTTLKLSHCFFNYRTGDEQHLAAYLTPLNVNCHASDGRKVCRKFPAMHVAVIISMYSGCTTALLVKVFAPNSF